MLHNRFQVVVELNRVIVPDYSRCQYNQVWVAIQSCFVNKRSSQIEIYTYPFHSVPSKIFLTRLWSRYCLNFYSFYRRNIEYICICTSWCTYLENGTLHFTDTERKGIFRGCSSKCISHTSYM